MHSSMLKQLFVLVPLQAAVSSLHVYEVMRRCGRLEGDERSAAMAHTRHAVLQALYKPGARRLSVND